MQTMLTVVTQNSRLPRRSALSGDRMAFGFGYPAFARCQTRGLAALVVLRRLSVLRRSSYLGVCRLSRCTPGGDPSRPLALRDGDLRIEIVAVLQRRARATLASREHAPVHRIAPKPTRHATPGRARSPGSRSIASITNCLAPAAPLRSEHRLGALCTLPAGASAPGSSFRRSN